MGGRTRVAVVAGVLAASAAAGAWAPSASATEKPAVGRTVLTFDETSTFRLTLVGPMPFGPAGAVGQLTATCEFWFPGWPIRCTFRGTANAVTKGLRSMTVTDQGSCTLRDNVEPAELDCQDRRRAWQATILPGADVMQPVKLVSLIARGRGGHKSTRHGLYSMPPINL